jgi:ADP-ribose pyrophosphatase YjhB (NUDIX family)
MKKGEIKFDQDYDGSPIFWMSQRRNKIKSMYLYFNCPGGHIEQKESRKDTLIRETQEETNITQQKQDYSFEFTQIYKEQKNSRDQGIRVVFCYSSYTDQEPITPREELSNMSQWQLYTLHEVLLMKTIDIVTEYVIRKLQEFPMNIKYITEPDCLLGYNVQYRYLQELCKRYKKTQSLQESLEIYYETKIHSFSRRQLFNNKRKDDNNNTTNEN